MYKNSAELHCKKKKKKKKFSEISEIINWSSHSVSRIRMHGLKKSINQDDQSFISILDYRDPLGQIKSKF